MIEGLPPWYPQADAAEDEIDAWLAADTPPYDEMRCALPWLTSEEQFDGWLDAVGDLRAHPERAARIARAFPGIATLPLPPRRLGSLK